MVGSKKDKKVKQREQPKGKAISQGGNPEEFYAKKPTWIFNNADQKMWAFTKEHIGGLLWTEILPRLKAFESQTWQEILICDKKKNHSLNLDKLNKKAQERLLEKYIEAESIISLRINGSHRLYGYMTGSTFNILWFDDNHGDNADCVCRSYLKHT